MPKPPPPTPSERDRRVLSVIEPLGFELVDQTNIEYLGLTTFAWKKRNGAPIRFSWHWVTEFTETYMLGELSLNCAWLLKDSVRVMRFSVPDILEKDLSLITDMAEALVRASEAIRKST
jgi:hypothetical protein